MEETRDIVVVGASAGGVKALQRFVQTLPADLPASVFVVLHSTPDAPCLLGPILDRAGPLPASCPTDGEAFRPGHIYTAPPDFHLLIEDGHIRLGNGPRENRHRPCINTLFRTAAAAHGPRVIGGVLTGTLDDGTSGLWWIRESGGITFVQNPADAEFPEMPLSVLAHMDVDYSVDIAEMGALISDLAGTATWSKTNGKTLSSRKGVYMKSEEPILVTCPECHGPLREVRLDSICEYRCLVGHAYSFKFLLEAHDHAEEQALWTAAAILEEAGILARKVGQNLPEPARLRIEEDAAEKVQLAAEVHRLVHRLRKFRVQDLPVAECGAP